MLRSRNTLASHTRNGFTLWGVCGVMLLFVICGPTSLLGDDAAPAAQTTLPKLEPSQLIPVWPDLAPGESTKHPGTTLPQRASERPPATRITDVTQPLLEIYLPQPVADGMAQKKTPALLIFPGGAYRYVVQDKEGSEIAAWLNRLGITAIVLRYRSLVPGSKDDNWVRPLQDAQRSLSLIRTQAESLGIDPTQIGVIGFSAGGQLAALSATRFDARSYDPIDTIDETSCRPDFAMLIYPWQLVEGNSLTLRDIVTVTPKTPPTFLVHAHDDSSTSFSSIAFYAALKTHKVAAELHLYENGGHGYGMRPVSGSNIHTWPDRATDWLTSRHLTPVPTE
ncbi:MAG: alpha/beta hydrolase [Planctomycetaceae bacterium]